MEREHNQRDSMTEYGGSRRGDDRTGSALQTAAAVVGAGFLLTGIAGFIPGLVSDFDSMTFAGHESGAELLGIFEVSVLHNIVHLLFGVVGLIAMRRWTWARGFLIGGGIIYVALWVYGLLVDHNDPANFVPVNDADNWLHLGLGVAMVLLGVLLDRDRAAARDRTRNA